MKLNKFTEDTTCIKCSSEDYSIQYSGVQVAVNKTVSGKYINIANRDEDELLIHTCDKCGYVWITEVFEKGVR